jgi:hypothetical protein
MESANKDKLHLSFINITDYYCINYKVLSTIYYCILSKLTLLTWTGGFFSRTIHVLIYGSPAVTVSRSGRSQPLNTDPTVTIILSVFTHFDLSH